MNTLKRLILRKKFKHYHKLAYKYFDKAVKWNGDEVVWRNEKYYGKYEKYMKLRTDVFDKLYPDI